MDIRKLSDEELAKEFRQKYWSNSVNGGDVGGICKDDVKIAKFIRQCVKDSQSEGLTVAEMYHCTADLVDEFFPKGKCAERGQALVLHAKILIAIHAAQERKGKEC